MFGKNVEIVRERNNIERVKFAERLHISSVYLYHVEREIKKPSYTLMMNIIRELRLIEPELSIDWLLEDDIGKIKTKRGK